MEEKRAGTQLAVLDLTAGQRLVLDRETGGDRITIVGRDGRIKLEVMLTENGCVLRLEGAGLAIETEGDLAIHAGRLAFHAQDAIEIASGGDAHVRAGGDLELSARVQTIVSELGNVTIRANDDVRIDGERILLNC